MKTLIFDMDGTLIDSSEAIAKSTNNIRSWLNLEPLPVKNIVDIINNPNKNWRQELYNYDKFPKDLESKANMVFMESYLKYANLYNGIYEMLENCQKNNFKICLASNAPKSFLNEILKNTKIQSFFDQIEGEDQNTPKKPNPKMLNNIINNKPLKNFFFIGDSQKDKEAAQNANITYIHALWGFSPLVKAKNKAKLPMDILTFVNH